MAENTPGLVPIPAPQPKTSYNAPIFQTFQDRRRAKDAARQVPLLPSAQVDHQYQPGPSALAMMARPGDPPPAPPSRPSVLPPAPPPRSPALPYSAQPSSPQAGPSRPLPRPLPTAVSASPINPPPTVPPSHPSPSSLERSDTVSSVRSLDRFGFSSSRRPLPRAPVGVNSSKSLDRGIPSGDDPVRRKSRKQPSIVTEEDDQVSPASGASPMPTAVVPTIAFSPDPDPPGIPNIAIEPTPTIAVHDTRSPAKFSPLPSFNLPDSDSEESNTGDTSGVELAALPAIAVSSGHSHISGPLPDGAIVCAGCEQPIIGRIVNAMGRRFHPACFKCDECGSLLEHVSSFEHDGKAYCHLDYHEVGTYRRPELTGRNSPTTATTARPPSLRTVSSRSTTRLLASGTTTSYTSSAPNAATHSSTRPNRPRPAPSAAHTTTSARPTRLSSTRVTRTASGVTFGSTSPSAKPARSQYQTSQSMRWAQSGIKTVSSARCVE